MIFEKKKEEDIPTWLLSIVQYELEFYSSTAPKLSNVEQAVRTMGPVKAIEMPGLEKFQTQLTYQPQLMLPPPESAPPPVNTTQSSNPFTNHSLQTPNTGYMNPSPKNSPRNSKTSSTVPLKASKDLPIPRTVKKARGLYDFNAQEAGELSFVAGEEVVITEDIGGGWLRAKNQYGQEGLIPGNYVQLLN